MPANLPPEYYDAEIKFKQAINPQDKVNSLEALISTVPKHKGTDKLRADLRRRLSKLREESARKKKGGRGDLYTVENQGAAQIALVGFANAGKSSLLAAATNAHPVIADFPMSTVMPLSGMMPFEDIQFQIIDLPPVGNESTDGWVSGVLRTTNVLMLIVDLSDAADIQTDLLMDQLSEWRIPVKKKSGTTRDENSLSPKPLIVVANKVDVAGAEAELKALREKYESLHSIISFSAREGSGVTELKQAVFDNSSIIRVYSKEPRKKADMDTPFTLPFGSTVLDLAEIIHKDFIKNLRYACIWGSAKFEGQRVQKDYALKDRDVVEYHIK